MRALLYTKEIALRTLLGGVVGMLLSAILFFTRLKASFLADDYPRDLSFIEWLWISASYPARLVFRLWVFVLHWPPQNDVAVMLVLPYIAVVMQWMLIGLLFGLWKCWKGKEVRDQL